MRGKRRQVGRSSPSLHAHSSSLLATQQRSIPQEKWDRARVLVSWTHHWPLPARPQCPLPPSVLQRLPLPKPIPSTSPRGRPLLQLQSVHSPAAIEITFLLHEALTVCKCSTTLLHRTPEPPKENAARFNVIIIKRKLSPLRSSGFDIQSARCTSLGPVHHLLESRAYNTLQHIPS